MAEQGSCMFFFLFPFPFIYFFFLFISNLFILKICLEFYALPISNLTENWMEALDCKNGIT
jgi:hypothetical protein